MLFCFFTKSGVLYNLIIIIISQANYEQTINQKSSDFLQIGFLALFLVFYLSQKLRCDYEKLKKDKELNKRLTRVNISLEYIFSSHFFEKDYKVWKKSYKI